MDDYYQENITRDLDNPNTQKMADIVDPIGKLRILDEKKVY